MRRLSSLVSGPVLGALLACGAPTGLAAQEAGGFALPEGLDWGGELFLEGRRADYADWFRPLAGEDRQAGGYGGRLKLSQAWRGGLSFSGEASFRDMEGEEPDLRIRRLRLAHQGDLTLEAGYDILGWSFFEQIHPLDPVERDAFRLDPDDLSRDAASPYAQISYPDAGGGLTRILAASGPQKPQAFSGEGMVYGLRHERYFGEAQAAGQVLFGPDEAFRIGGGLNMAAGAQIWALELEHVSDAEDFLGEERSGLRMAVGIRRALGGNSQLDFGYHHNGPGLGREEWDALRARLGTASQGLSWGDFSGAGLMADFAEASRERFLRRDYLFASYSSADRFGPLEFTLGAYYGLADQGALGFLDVEYDLTEALSLQAEAALGLGSEDSEFGMRPASLSLRLVYAFGANP